jgi:hypothetical protein
MKVEVLYFKGCPNHAPALQMVRRVLDRERIEAEVRSVEVPGETESDSLRFLGSPSIRVDGVDIESGRQDDSPFFGCRTYSSGGMTAGVPPEEWLLAALNRTSE